MIWFKERQGEATIYYDNTGNVYEIVNYVDGEKNGESICFYDEKNSIVEVRNYINDQVQGEGKLYLKGKLIKIRFYKDGELEGETDVSVG
ncbi:hypothetical protein [Fusobacterium sp.]|uniref:hypothetical protein n=1 Tax=Fusobacterium sp. TaxID=68766 RepID=UPI00396CC621